MTDRARSWPAGAATGIGSLPGTDPAEAVRLVFGELPELPYLPELPHRGAGADLIGRGAALLVDMPVEIQPSGWRITARPGQDLRRARDFLAYDLDALATHTEGYQGPLKVQAAGPLTLAAQLELPNGHKAISDHGAVADLTASLADGLAAHLHQVGELVPGAQLVLQLDEPSLPAVLAGHILTPSGDGTIRAVDEIIARDWLSTVLAVADEGTRVVHCCAGDVPLLLLQEAGANAIALDLDQITDLDPLGELVEAGVSLWLGALPSTGTEASHETVRDRIQAVWRTLGFAASQLAAKVVPTTACGLAGATPDYVRQACTAVRDAGRTFLDVS